MPCAKALCLIHLLKNAIGCTQYSRNLINGNVHHKLPPLLSYNILWYHIGNTALFKKFLNNPDLLISAVSVRAKDDSSWVGKFNRCAFSDSICSNNKGT
jgi:hypothetical protein